MNVFIAGNGSMGRRRERDLRTLGVDAKAYDAWPSRGLTPEQITAFDAADVIIVSTPPLQHTRVAVWADMRKLPCFTETDVRKVLAPHFPSATPLFTSWYAKMREDFHTEGAISYTLHVGQHIDDWHPGADPKTYYAYQPETRPTREMIPFELIWLSRLYGPVERAEGFLGLDVAHVIAHHAGGTVGLVFVDALSRPAVRDFTIVGDGYRRTWNLTYTEADYLAEMRALVDAIEGRAPWPYSQSEEAANLEVLRMIERSG